MVDALKTRPLVFDRGIDRILYQPKEDGDSASLPSADRILPSEDVAASHLDAVIHAPSVEDGLRQYLTPTITNRDLLRPASYGASIEEISLTLPYDNPSDLGGYRIAVGLKPTQEELQYNRRAR